MTVPGAFPIPLDVCFLVIDIVANDNDDEDPVSVRARYTTLRGCALTCQDWLEKSRAQLYRSVVLWQRDDFESFAETLATSAYLGSLVKSLRCELTSLMHAGDVNQTPLPMHVIRRLVSLESLTVVSNFLPFSPSLVGFLESFSICGALDSLYIRGCYFVDFEHLAGAVLSFPHIKSLQIR